MLQVGIIINDRVDVALASGAHGVHVGQDDLPAKAARDLLGPNKILGVSVKTVEQAQQAAADGADYLGAGASKLFDRQLHFACTVVGPCSKLLAISLVQTIFAWQTISYSVCICTVFDWLTVFYMLLVLLYNVTQTVTVYAFCTVFDWHTTCCGICISLLLTGTQVVAVCVLVIASWHTDCCV